MTAARRSLLLAALLLAAPALGTRAHAAPLPTATLEIAPARLAVAQTHGHVSRPVKPVGYSLSVRGAPGTRFEVYTTATGGTPILAGAGTIPHGGSITMAVLGPGTPSAPSEKVLVSSRATARIAVVLAYT